MPYTIAIAGVGVLSFFVANSVIEKYASTGEEFLKPSFLLVGLPFVVIAANICYTLGWVIELVRYCKNEARPPRKILFYSGFMLSILLMSLPVWAAILSWIGRGRR